MKPFGEERQAGLEEDKQGGRGRNRKQVWKGMAGQEIMKSSSHIIKCFSTGGKEVGVGEPSLQPSRLLGDPPTAEWLTCHQVCSHVFKTWPHCVAQADLQFCYLG